MKEKNFTAEFKNLVTNNKINGRITTNPFENSNEPMSTEMSFNDIMIKDNIAIFIDDLNEDRAETMGAFKINMNQIKAVHIMEDALELDNLYGQYDALVLMGEDYNEVLIAFNMNDENESPFILENEDALSYAYAKENIKELDYFRDKPVEIDISTTSYQSRYDADNDIYSNPIFASLEIISFDYATSVVDGIPCMTITDKNNKNVELTLNAITGVIKCNTIYEEPDNKRIYHAYTEIGLVTIKDKGYQYPSNKSEVA